MATPFIGIYASSYPAYATGTTTPPVPVSPVITSFSPMSGVQGSTVLITGNGFTGATLVSINSATVASFVVDSATQLTAVLSGSQATGRVRVTTPAGTAVSANEFTVTTPVPTGPFGFTPPQGLAGTTVTLQAGTGRAFGATAGTVTFNSVPATLTSWADQQIVVKAPAGGTGRIVITAAGGTVLTSNTDFIVMSAGDFTVADATWAKIDELAMVGIVDHDPVYSVKGAASSTPGTFALVETEVWSQPCTPIGPSYGMELNVKHSFGKGRINNVRFFLEKANGDRVGAIWDATTGGFNRFHRIGGNEVRENNYAAARPDSVLQTAGSGVPVLPEFDLAWTTASNSWCLVVRGGNIYNDTNWHIWDRGLMPFDARREENLNATTGFVRAVVSVEGEGTDGATFDLGAVTAGYLQGLGIANQAPVLWEDGGVVSEGGRFLEGASIPLYASNPASAFSGVECSNAVIRDRDLDAGTYRDRAKIWFHQVGAADGIARHIGHNSITWIRIGNNWYWYAGKWGTLGDGTEKMGIIAGMVPNLPSGPTVLVGTLMNLPDYGGFAEDPGICVKNGVIYFTYSTNVTQAFTAYVGTLDTPLGNFTLIAKTDTTGDVREGNKLIDEDAASLSLLVTNAPTTPGVDSKVRVYPFSGIVNGILSTYSTWTNRNLNEAGAPAHPNRFPRRVVDPDGSIHTEFYRMAFNGETYDYYYDGATRRVAPFGWSNKEFILKADKRTAGYAWPLRPIPA